MGSIWLRNSNHPHPTELKMEGKARVLFMAATQRRHAEWELTRREVRRLQGLHVDFYMCQFVPRYAVEAALAGKRAVLNGTLASVPNSLSSGEHE